MLFEKFDAAGMYLCTTATLSLYASGRTTGQVIECGHSHSIVTSVYEGYSLPHSIERNEVAGKAVTA
jgi:actin-related protein